MTAGATSNSLFETAKQALRSHWGYEQFRPGQAEVIQAVLHGRDAFVVLPTGGGKSLCYQVPALVQEGLTLVVSPLIALMQDQVEGLNGRGISAAYINSTLSRREIEQRLIDAQHGRYRLLYVAPERLTTETFEARAPHLSVSLIAVDEAHCVSEWGHHFRPDYLAIAQARQTLGGPPLLAVTATATPEVRRDVLHLLELQNPFVLVKGFDRPNIVWSVFQTENKGAKVADVLEGVPGSGLVYCATRGGVERWVRRLRAQGQSADGYHAGLSTAKRAAVQRAWIEGRTRVVVATNAFGMGIDKPDVRFVVHADLPASLEAYYQEAGRAGRDGDRAYAVLLYRPGDEDTQQALIDTSHPGAAQVKAIYEATVNLAQVPVGTCPEAPLGVQVERVAELAATSPSAVQQGIELLARQGVWQRLPTRRHQVSLRFTQPAPTIRAYAQRLSNGRLRTFVLDLLRAVHADAFTTWWEVDVRLLERRTGLPRQRVQGGLDYLAGLDMLRWQGASDRVRLQLLEPRTARLAVEERAVRRARRRAEKRLTDMTRYARGHDCRRHHLLAYFGESAGRACGACDVCLGRHERLVITPDDEPLIREVLQQVAAGEAVSDLVPALETSERQTTAVVDWLVQEGFLDPDDGARGAYQLTDKARAWIDQWKPRA